MNPTADAWLYPREYFDQYANDLKREAMYTQEYERICKRTRPGRVLDIGCGIGGFLSRFDGWELYGFEPSSFAAEQAKRKGVYVVESIEKFGTGTMDLVIFRGTLQHIAFPMQALAQAARILRPGGTLAILATPDTDSLVYKLWGNLPALDAQRNWIVFGSRFLVNVLRRLGYKDIEVLHPYKGTPYASPLKDACKFVASLLFGWRPFAFPGNMMEIHAVKQ